jgi:hypothetical protein
MLVARPLLTEFFRATLADPELPTVDSLAHLALTSGSQERRQLARSGRPLPT